MTKKTPAISKKPRELTLTRESKDTIDHFMHALRAVKIASDSGDMAKTSACLKTFIRATNALTVEAVSIMGLLPQLYEAATDIEFSRFYDGEFAQWLESELSFHPAGSVMRAQSAYWSPSTIQIDTALLVALRQALHPGWKAPGQP